MSDLTDEIQEFDPSNTPADIPSFMDLDCNLKDYMALTITLKPKLYTYQTITQYEMTINYISSILRQAKSGTYVTEITKAGNIHYHAVIKTRDKSNGIYIINAIRKNRLIGFYKVKEIKDSKHLEDEFKYLHKDIKETARILHTRNYKPDIINYFN